jgi:hypothetical protein
VPSRITWSFWNLSNGNASFSDMQTSVVGGQRPRRTLRDGPHARGPSRAGDRVATCRAIEASDTRRATRFRFPGQF